MMLKHFIEKLSTDLGFEQELDANEDGSYSLLLEPDIDITLRESPESLIMFHTKVSDLPPIKTEDYMVKLMTANLLGRETGGAALGLDNEGKKVVLVDFLVDEQNYKAFHERLEDFANYAEAWRQETTQFIEEQEAAE